ncbi:hypothetical protein RhiLY_03897 [Ceratobasidium sp. AG-Ba]|nr:hypothetical protein RhiLY_03897 [Ceratobasidium sp. AG-Ba]
MFSRSRLSTRGEEEQLSAALATNSPLGPSSRQRDLARPPVAAATSPMSAASAHPHYLGSYETLARRQSQSGNDKKLPTLHVEKPTEGIFSPGATVLDQRPTVIHDPFTGEPAATLSSDHAAPDTSWSMFEGELQSEVAKMHIAMESIGQPPPPQPTKEKEKDKHKEARKLRSQTTSARNRNDKHSPDATAARCKKDGPCRACSAADTGKHFIERKEAIQEIMQKLTALSQQVTEFHQLPPPEITFPASPTRQQAPQS